MTAVGMNNLWNYIQGLSLSAKNQAWLAARLTEASLQQKTKNKKKKLSKEIEAIPEEYRCDPYEISPSGDPFFADKRNVEELRSRIEDAHNGCSKIVATLQTREDITQFLESL